jgi:hypothetical protein
MTKYLFWGILFLLLSVANVFASQAKSETENVVFGSGNVQVHNSAETEVNGQKVKVESDKPGSLELEMKEDQVRIKTSQGITPTIAISNKKITPTICLITPISVKAVNNSPSLSIFIRNLIKSLLDKLSWSMI